MRKPQGIEPSNSFSTELPVDDSEIQLENDVIPSIIIVDPDPDFASTVSDYLKLFGYQICFHTDIEEALSHIKQNSTDVIFLGDGFDYHHPIDILRQFKSVLPDARIAILANKGDDQLAVELLKAGASDYLSRRVKDKDVLTSIAALLENLVSDKVYPSTTLPSSEAVSTPNLKNELDEKQATELQESQLIQADDKSKKASSKRQLSRKFIEAASTFDILPGVLLCLDDALLITKVNDSCLNLLGYEKSDILFRPIKDFLPSQICAELIREVSLIDQEYDIEIVAPVNGNQSFELVITNSKGVGIPIRCQLNKIRTSEGVSERTDGYILSIENITEEKAKQADLLYRSMWSNILQGFAHRFINLKLEDFSEELTAIVSETATFFRLDRISIFLFDKNMSKAKIYLEWIKNQSESLKQFSKKIEIEAELPEFSNLLVGKIQLLEPEKNIKGGTMNQCCGISEHYAQVGASSSAILPILKQAKVIGWIALDFQDGDYFWSENDIALVEPLGQLISEAFTRRSQEEQRKVTHQKLSENHGRLSEQAFLDGLTNLANRRYFDKVLESEVRRASRDKTNIAILFCDIDYFKAYNDTYGHLEGDLCLKAIASVLQREFQRAGDFVARFGGEEFAVILSGMQTADAQDAADKLRNQVLQMNVAHQGSPIGKISMSIGIECVESPDPNDSKKILNQADKALYKAKANGRNRVELASR